MSTGMIVTEAQRARAYQRATGKTLAQITPAAPRPMNAATRTAASSPCPDQSPRVTKHALLAMLHARSNAGSVRLRDVSQVLDELSNPHP